MVRPSAKATLSSWVVQDTSIANALPLSTKVRMPSLQEELFVLKDHPPNTSDLVTSEALYLCQRYRLEPEFGITSSVSYVNVWRFASLHAKEEKPIPANL